MPIYSETGRLGKGKTLRAVLRAYEAYCNGQTVYSTLPLFFPHIPVKCVSDFLKIKNGFFLWDEGWFDIDRRNSNSKKNKFVSVILLRSRKQEFTVNYTQQSMQADIRLMFVTDWWERPCVYPFDPEGQVKLIPEVLVVERYDCEFQRKPDEVFEGLEPYLNLYNTHQDPYSVAALFNPTEFEEATKAALKEDKDVEEMYIRVTESAFSPKGQAKARRGLEVLA